MQFCCETCETKIKPHNYFSGLRETLNSTFSKGLNSTFNKGTKGLNSTYQKMTPPTQSQNATFDVSPNNATFDISPYDVKGVKGSRSSSQDNDLEDRLSSTSDSSMSHRLNDLGDVQHLARMQEESKYTVL